MTIDSLGKNNGNFDYPVGSNPEPNNPSSDSYAFHLEASHLELPSSVEVQEELNSPEEILDYLNDVLEKLEQITKQSKFTEELDIASDFSGFTEKNDKELNDLANKYVSKIIDKSLSDKEIGEIKNQLNQIKNKNPQIKKSNGHSSQVFRLLNKHVEAEVKISPTQDKAVEHPKQSNEPSQGYFKTLAKNIPLYISHRASQQKIKQKYSIRKSDIPALEASSKVAAKTISSQFSTLFPKERVLETAVEIVESDNGSSWVRVLDPERCTVLKDSFNHRIEGLFRSYKFCLDNKKLSDREVQNLAKETRSAWVNLVTDKKTNKIYWSCNDAKRHLWQLKQESENECFARGLDPYMKDNQLNSADDRQRLDEAA